MTEKIILGVLIGAAVGFAIGMVGSKSGGSCPFLCNPVIAALLGAAIGGGLVSTFKGKLGSSYTPSPFLVDVRTKTDFEAKVLKVQGLVLADFSTSRCPWCVKLEPTMHGLADAYAGRVTVARVDLMSVPEAGLPYKIRGVPTLILFKDGKPIEQVRGYCERSVLEALLDKHAPPPNQGAPESNGKKAG